MPPVKIQTFSYRINECDGWALQKSIKIYLTIKKSIQHRESQYYDYRFYFRPMVFRGTQTVKKTNLYFGNPVQNEQNRYRKTANYSTDFVTIVVYDDV